MLVLPPTVNTRWGGHYPSKKASGLIHSIYLVVFLSLMAASHCMIAEATEDPMFRCKLRPDSEEVKPKLLYIKDKEHAVTLMTSRRIPHLLLTHVVTIFLRDYLGYSNIVVTYNDSLYPVNVLRALGYPDPRHYYDLSEYYIIPNALINLELWFPPVKKEHILEYFGSNSYLGVVGRLGWFFPQYLITKHNLTDYWKIFMNPESQVHKIFWRSPQELAAMKKDTIDPKTDQYYCEDKRCVNGIYTPSVCYNVRCAVLFASSYNLSSFLIDQIANESLYVQVVWLGPNMDRDFMNRNIHYKDSRSVLLFHYTPDILVEPFNLTSIVFPPCSDEKFETFCEYELHHLRKFIWNGLKFADSILFDSLEKISIDKDNFLTLLTAYIDNPGKTEQEIACSWMKKNKEVWKIWSSSDEKPSLYVMGMFPIKTTSSERKFLAPGCVSAFLSAIDAVNANSSILPNHQLEAYIVNTECDADLVMLEFIRVIKFSSREDVYNKLVGIVGPACSDTVEPIAGVAKYFNMAIISYAAEGAIFSDRVKYPYFFRTIPENKIFRHVYLQLFKKFKWKRIASLTEDGHQYSDYLTSLDDLLQSNNIDFEMRKYPQEAKVLNMTTYMLELKQKSYRIIIGDFYQDVARVVFCEAFRQKMTEAQGYVWFIPRWYSDDWYDVDVTNREDPKNALNCTTEQMLQGLQGHMTLSYKYFADDSCLTPENISVKKWRQRYEENLADVSGCDYAGFTYDAVWTYALALNKLFKEDFPYSANLRSSGSVEKFTEYINKTNFEGVSGHIDFKHGYSRYTDIVVYQFINKSYKEVGRFLTDAADELTQGSLELYKNKFTWHDGVVPNDGSKKCIVETFRLFFGAGTNCTSAIIILCTISFGSLAVLLILIVIFLKHRYELKLRMMEEKLKDKGVFKQFEGWEIPRYKVVTNRKLAEGQFGTVYGGECEVDPNVWQAVAVKTLKVGSILPEKLDFLCEAETMKNVSHENIVKLIGVCTESEPFLVIMEFMLYGDLRTFLLERRNLVSEKNRNDNDEVSNCRLTSMALDVARALAHLADLKYVHRDIASRNCLVNTHCSVKLADFGMTKPLNENGYYKLSRKVMVPVRWMAPESLMEGIFTTKSDIWSFGVVLYEIITFGAVPFQGLTNSEVYKRVQMSQTLPIPNGINPELEMLMMACWHPIPAERITACAVAALLINHPRLISPSLDAPQSSMTMPIENPAGLELRIPDKSRKHSMSLNNSRAANNQGSSVIPSSVGGLMLSNKRKRSMSGNMMLPPVAEDISSTIDALNLTEELSEDRLLPPSHYISSSCFLSLSNKDIERERELLVKKQLSPPSVWTNMTPV